MAYQSPIHFLQNGEIDRFRWDDCVHTSHNGLIYARSFYLDNMCPGWTALIGENYEWVLPITHRTKWGIRYLFQPAFTQQLGVFAHENTNVPVEEIIERLQQYATFWEVNWNYAAENISAKNFTTQKATNFILDLSTGYTAIAADYHNDLVKNLKLAKRFNHRYQKTDDYRKLIQLYRQHYAARLPMVKDADYHNFEKLAAHLQETNGLVCREVVDENGEVLACVLLLKDDKRLYNIMNTTTEAGRKSKANHFLFDTIIREFSSTELLLDFEGSDLPGVKPFYENFGALNQPFFKIKYNNLPWLVKVVKK